MKALPILLLSLAVPALHAQDAGGFEIHRSDTDSVITLPVTTTRRAWSPTADLTLAAFQNDLARVQRLLALGTDPDAFDDEGRTAMLMALNEGHVEVMRAILDSGRPIDKLIVSETKEGVVENTPLLIAIALARSPEMVGYLLQRGADVNATGRFYEKDAEGKRVFKWTISPVGLAATKFNRAILLRVLDRNPELNINNYMNGAAIHAAALYGTVENLTSIVRRRADLNFRNAAGRTALELAIEAGRMPQVKALIELGANVNVADGNGWTPAMEACRVGNLELLKLLDEKGANLGARTKKGSTLLFPAAVGNKRDVVQYLLDRGVDPDAKNNEGQTAYMMIRAMPGVKDPRVLNLLRDVTAKENRGG